MSTKVRESGWRVERAASTSHAAPPDAAPTHAVAAMSMPIHARATRTAPGRTAAIPRQASRCAARHRGSAASAARVNGRVQARTDSTAMAGKMGNTYVTSFEPAVLRKTVSSVTQMTRSSTARVSGVRCRVRHASHIDRIDAPM